MPPSQDSGTASAFSGTIRTEFRLRHPVGMVWPASLEYQITPRRWKIELVIYRGMAVAGQIIDLDRDEVIIYRKDQVPILSENGHAVRMSLAEYKRSLLHLGTRALQEQPDLPSNPYFSLDLDVMDRREGPAVSHFGAACRTTILEGPQRRVVTESCPHIRVSREILELAFPNIPAEIQGFPVTINTFVERSQWWKDFDSVISTEIEIKAVSPKPVDLQMPSGMTMHLTMAAFLAAMAADGMLGFSSGGGFDFD